MGKGKIAAQCAHAAVTAVLRAQRENRKELRYWYCTGQKKIAVKVKNMDELNVVRKECEDADLQIVTIRYLLLLLHLCSCAVTLLKHCRDAGHTQIKAGSLTVMAIGPAPSELIDAVTGHLRLL